MKKEDLKLNVRYIVTKESDDGTLEERDIIYLEEDSVTGLSLYCAGAGGWLPAEFIDAALEGVEVILHTAYYRAKVFSNLQSAFVTLNEYIGDRKTIDSLFCTLDFFTHSYPDGTEKICAEDAVDRLRKNRTV
jgi:hypothetical protein